PAEGGDGAVHDGVRPLETQLQAPGDLLIPDGGRDVRFPFERPPRFGTVATVDTAELMEGGLSHGRRPPSARGRWTGRAAAPGTGPSPGPAGVRGRRRRRPPRAPWRPGRRGPARSCPSGPSG